MEKKKIIVQEGGYENGLDIEISIETSLLGGNIAIVQGSDCVLIKPLYLPEIISALQDFLPDVPKS